ncbi:MAG: DUF5723 family protein [Cyclobacteriaceae bacterium]
MKSAFLLSLLLAISLCTYYQPYSGMIGDNYIGVLGVTANPANIVDSRYRTDVNIFSINSILNNDFYGVKFSEVIKDGYDFDSRAAKFPKDENNVNVIADFFGPSFMTNISPSYSIAVFTRARAFVNVNNIDGELLNNIIDEFENEPDFISENNNVVSSIHGWGEIGASFGAVVYSNGRHFVKAGISITYLPGIGSAGTDTDDLDVAYDADGFQSSPGETSGLVTTSGTLTYNHTSNFNDDYTNFEIIRGAWGLGVDFGAVYEFRHEKYADADISQRDENKYFLKVGVAVTDLGSISYNDATRKSYDATGSFSENAFDDYDDLEEFLDDNYQLLEESTGTKAVLPSALRINADIHAARSFYVNVNTDLRLAGSKNASRINNNFSITPRYEIKWFSAFMPFNVNQYSGFSWGAGIRTGVFHIGSGSILSNLFSSESKEIDFFFGFKVPVFQR